MPTLPSFRRALPLAALLASVLLVRPAVAEEAKDKKDEKAEPPELVTAEKGAFSVVLDLDGTLDAASSTPIEVHTDAYGGELEPTAAPVLGPTVVKAGDLLVTFDPAKLDEQIAGARREIELGTLGLDRAKEEAKRNEAESGRNLARAKVERDRAVEALDYFNKVERARRTTESELELKGSNDSVTDQIEELGQLTKMYKADDVVEETEKIVMARAERALERSRKYLAIRTEEHDRLIKVELPRELEDREHAAAHASADYERTFALVPMDLEKARREIAKSELELAIQAKNLERLGKDRARFEVRAPSDGLVVPGSLVDGKWSGGDDVVRALRAKEALKLHQVLFTLLPGSAFVVRVALPEASILDVVPGRTAEVRLAAQPARVLSAKVSSIGRTSAEGRFDVVLDLGATDERWMPGFACKVKLTTRTSPDAVTVPDDSVVSKGDTHKVYLWVDGKSVAKEVEVGASSGGSTEITKGLDAGTKVLESPPK